MKLLSCILSLFVLTAINQHSVAQNIDSQFKNMIEKSNNYQEYKVVRKSDLQQLWKNTSDTLRKYNQDLKTAQANISEKNSAINQLKGNLVEKDNSLNEALNSVNEISFLGFIPLAKSSYNLIMWGLIGALLVVIAFLYFGFAKAKKDAREKIQLYQELSEEHKTFRAKSQENERKLARELQDERNKLAEYNIR